MAAKLPESVPSTPKEATAASSDVALPFALEKDLFASILADYGIAKELEDIVGKRVANDIESKWSVEHQRIGVVEKAAQENGYAAGYAAGKLQAEKEFALAKEEYWKEFSNRLNGICEEILKEKEKILHDHEKLWCQGTTNVLKRFQVGRALDLGKDLERWLSEAITDFSTRSKIKIFVSEEEFARYSGSPKESQKWEVFPDMTLKKGESRYESEGGGVFFSPSEAFNKLEVLLKQYDV